MERRKATLLLGNGSRFEGWSFGADRPASGEVVFSTSMVGYPESLTDPSFEGQILFHGTPQELSVNPVVLDKYLTHSFVLRYKDFQHMEQQRATSAAG